MRLTLHPMWEFVCVCKRVSVCVYGLHFWQFIARHFLNSLPMTLNHTYICKAHIWIHFDVVWWGGLVKEDNIFSTHPKLRKVFSWWKINEIYRNFKIQIAHFCKNFVSVYLPSHNDYYFGICVLISILFVFVSFEWSCQNIYNLKQKNRIFYIISGFFLFAACDCERNINKYKDKTRR